MGEDNAPKAVQNQEGFFEELIVKVRLPRKKGALKKAPPITTHFQEVLSLSA